MKFNLEYGTLDQNGAIIDASRKNRDVQLTKLLQPGTKTFITINLNDIAPSEISYIIVTNVNFDKIDFRNAR